MKKIFLLTVALLAVVAAPAVQAATRPVDITRTGFAPDKLTIDPGDTVTWTNKDTAPHQVVADRAEFPSSPVLQPNQAYSHTFTRSGTFTYRDALNRNERGTITVRPGVSLAAGLKLIRFGSSTRLSGAVSSGAAGEAVVIEAQECGKPTFTRLASATSTTNGAWTTTVKPTLNTVYQARWKGATSAKVEVKVMPRVALVKVRTGRFTARVGAAQSFVGKYVVLQRYAAARRRWVTLKRVVLRTATTVGTTTTSSASFRSRVARGTRLRLVLPQGQAGTCYAAARSGTVRA